MKQKFDIGIIGAGLSGLSLEKILIILFYLRKVIF
jgi:cation diffusion facilitator CzcD-associated flavoprotein CzcO